MNIPQKSIGGGLHVTKPYDSMALSGTGLPDITWTLTTSCEPIQLSSNSLTAKELVLSKPLHSQST